MGVWFLNINYSIDKVRLKVELDVKYVMEQLELFKVEPNCNYYQRYSIKEYRHNFNFEDYNAWGEKCSFWLGVQHNSKNLVSVVDVVFEYNPNKCEGSYLVSYICDRFYKNNSHVEVRKLDIAMDMPVNILSLKVVKDRRDMTTIDKGADNRTYYVGAPGSDGRVKIYNKTRESKLNYDLTRYEVTITPKMFIDTMIKGFSFDVGNLVDVICASDVQLDFDMKGQDVYNVLTALDNPALLNLLDKRKAKKIKDILSSIGSVRFDIEVINSTVINFLKTIYTL